MKGTEGGPDTTSSAMTAAQKATCRRKLVDRASAGNSANGPRASADAFQSSQ